MPWEAGPSADLLDATDGLDRLALATPLLGATGWIDTLGRLVATPQPSGEALRDTLRDMLAPLGFGLRALPGGEGPPSLVAARRTGRPPCTLLFPLGLAAPGPGWRRPPHALTRHGDRLHGHGIAQVKGAIAATWAALCVADAVGLRLRHDPVLLFTPDAPSGPGEALRSLLRQGHLSGELAGPLLHLGGLAGPRRWAGAPGSLEVEIRVSAASAAAAAQAARPVLARLMELRAELGTRAAPGAEPVPRLSVLSVQALPESGDAPAACLLRLQRRFDAAEGAAAAEAGLRHLLAEMPEAGALALRRLSLQPAAATPAEGAPLLRWEQALRWGFGYGPQPFRPYACSEPSPLGHASDAGLVDLLQGGLLRQGQASGAAEESTTVEEVEALSRSLLAFLSEAAP